MRRRLDDEVDGKVRFLTHVRIFVSATVYERRQNLAGFLQRFLDDAVDDLVRFSTHGRIFVAAPVC